MIGGGGSIAEDAGGRLERLCLGRGGAIISAELGFASRLDLTNSARLITGRCVVSPFNGEVDGNYCWPCRFQCQCNRTAVLYLRQHSADYIDHTTRSESAMNRDLLRNLLLYIVDQLQDMESPISTIRLVKFLYLIDLDYYNQHGQTLTGINWFMYTYGPYFFEWSDLVKSIGFDLETEEVKTPRGHGLVYRTRPQSLGTLSIGVRGLADRVLKQRADDDLEELLERVYDTLPVKHGVRGHPLDFTLETDHLLLEEARKSATEFHTLDEFLAACGDDEDGG